MKNYKLDKEEKALLKSIEHGERETVKNSKAKRKRYDAMARATLLRKPISVDKAYRIIAAKHRKSLSKLLDFEDKADFDKIITKARFQARRAGLKRSNIVDAVKTTRNDLSTGKAQGLS